MKRVFLYIFLLFIPLAFIICGCKKNNGILYKIFSISYKTWKPLDTKREAVNERITGDYIVAGERALQIEKKDSTSYIVRFLPEYLGEGIKQLEGFITTLNNRQYLNVFTDDENYLFFRLDSAADSTEIKLLTHDVETYTKGTDLAAWLKKDGFFPDTSRALFKLPLKKLESGQATEFCKNKLRPQVSDLPTFKLYSQIFPADEKTEELRTKATETSFNRTNSVARLYKLGQDYPHAAEKARQRARTICYTTENCIDYLKFYTEAEGRDTLIELAFNFAGSEADYHALIKNFPDHKKMVQIMTRLYFLEKKKCKTDADLRMLTEKYKSDKLFSSVISAVQVFDRIPFEEIKFNRNSYVLTKESKEFLDRVLYSIAELNKEKQLVQDVYVAVNCDIVPSHYPNADYINFRHSINRSVTLKKYVAAKGNKSVNFHFMPCGTGRNANDSLSDGLVKVTVNEKQADEYKSRFMKLCLNKKGIGYADANRELITNAYLREEELENYCMEVILEKLAEDRKAEFKIIPGNFLMEDYKKDLPESGLIYLNFLKIFEEKKIRKRDPMEFVVEMK